MRKKPHGAPISKWGEQPEYEKARSEPGLTMLVALAEVLGVSLDWLALGRQPGATGATGASDEH